MSAMEPEVKPKLHRAPKNKALKDDFVRFEQLAKRITELSENRQKFEKELDGLIESLDQSDLKTVSETATKIAAQEKLYEECDKEYFAKSRSLAKLKREWRKEIVESYLQEAKNEKQRRMQDAMKQYSEQQVVHDNVTFMPKITKTPGMTTSDGLARSKWDIPATSLDIDTVHPLGSGQFGTVYRAKLLGKEVAVKILNIEEDDEEAIEGRKLNEISLILDFIKEVNIMVTLRHPHIILFIGACTEPGNLALITEMMTKGSVADVLHPKNSVGSKISLKRKMLIAKETAQGMNYLHLSEPAILHLDLKPANLLIDENWTVKVADFGLSRMRPTGYSVTMDSAVGSPMFMSPEMMIGKKTGTKSDVYSFGIILWELYTEKVPYNNRFESFNELCEAIAFENERPPMPIECPTKLKALIRACWDPEPSNRPSFKEMLEGNVFDEIMLEGMISKANETGIDLWRENFFEKYAVNWKDFLGGFVNFMNISFDKIRLEDLEKTLKNALNVENEIVTLENYANMLEWLGPLNGQAFAEKIIHLYSKSWFHGVLSPISAENLLNGHSKRKRGSYLIRFSLSEPGSYAVSFVAKDESIQHIQIAHRANQGFTLNGVDFVSLDDLITAKAKLKSMKPKISLKYAVPSPISVTIPNAAPSKDRDSLRARKSMLTTSSSGLNNL